MSFMGLICAGAAGFLVYNIIRHSSADNKPSSLPGTMRDKIDKFKKYWDVTKFKIIFSTFQIIAALDWGLEITFPEPFATVENALSSVTELSIEHIMPMGCLMRYDHYKHILLVTLVPLLLVAFLLTGAFIVSKTDDATGGKYIHASLLCSFLFLPSSSVALLRTFHCLHLDDGGGNWLIADYGLDCDSKIHGTYMMFSGLMVVAVFPCGALAIYLYALALARRRINPVADNEFTAYSVRARDESIQMLRSLYEPYRPHLWVSKRMSFYRGRVVAVMRVPSPAVPSPAQYFEIVDMTRRITMMGSVIFIGGRPTRAAVSFVLALFYCALYREMNPYTTASIGALSTCAHWLIVLLYGAGVVRVSRPFGYNEMGLGVFLLGAALGLSAVAIMLQMKNGTSARELEHQVRVVSSLL